MSTLADIDETLPAGTEEASNGDNRIRAGRVAIKTTFGSEHQLTGEHKFPYGDTASRPAAGNAGRIYLNNETGYIDKDNGTAWEKATPALLPSGTQMLFYQDTAPVGWTIQDTLDDKVVYVSKGSAAGGETGGGVHSTGSWTISGLSASTTVDGHAITIDEMPAHTHSYSHIVAGGTQELLNSGHDNHMATFDSGSTGGNAAHTHGASTSVSQDGSWRPSAYVCIIAKKD